MRRALKLKAIAYSLGLPLCSEWDGATSGILLGWGNGDLREWNPYRADVQAFELSILARVDITHTSTAVFASLFRGRAVSAESPVRNNSRAAATRRSIVEAVFSAITVDNRTNSD